MGRTIQTGSLIGLLSAPHKMPAGRRSTESSVQTSWFIDSSSEINSSGWILHISLQLGQVACLAPYLTHVLPSALDAPPNDKQHTAQDTHTPRPGYRCVYRSRGWLATRPRPRSSLLSPTYVRAFRPGCLPATCNSPALANDSKKLRAPCSLRAPRSPQLTVERDARLLCSLKKIA
jgi:hypothetical protein